MPFEFDCMNSAAGTIESERATKSQRSQDLVSELLILPDGRVLVHSLTPTFAALLSELNPNCEQIASRTTNPTPRLNELPN